MYLGNRLNRERYSEKLQLMCQHIIEEGDSGTETRYKKNHEHIFAIFSTSRCKFSLERRDPDRQAQSVFK